MSNTVHIGHISGTSHELIEYPDIGRILFPCRRCSAHTAHIVCRGNLSLWFCRKHYQEFIDLGDLGDLVVLMEEIIAENNSLE